jgi:hypothetical protein
MKLKKILTGKPHPFGRVASLILFIYSRALKMAHIMWVLRIICQIGLSVITKVDPSIRRTEVRGWLISQKFSLLLYIAETCNSALRTGRDDITGFIGQALSFRFADDICKN